MPPADWRYELGAEDGRCDLFHYTIAVEKRAGRRPPGPLAQYATVKRRWWWAGLSISSTNAIA